MIETIEALDAWWPPTFTPERFGRTRLAWWTIAVASHSTRRSTASSPAISLSQSRAEPLLSVVLSLESKTITDHLRGPCYA